MDAIFAYCCVLTSLSMSRVGTCGQTGRASRSGWSPVMENLPHWLPAHAHFSCLQVPLLVTARHQRDRAVLGHPAVLCVLRQPVTMVLAQAILCFLYPLPPSWSIPRSPAVLSPWPTSAPETFSAVTFYCSCFGLWVLPSIWSHQLPSFRSAYTHFLKTILLSFSFLSLSLFCLFLFLSHCPFVITQDFKIVNKFHFLLVGK